VKLVMVGSGSRLPSIIAAYLLFYYSYLASNLI